MKSKMELFERKSVSLGATCEEKVALTKYKMAAGACAYLPLQEVKLGVLGEGFLCLVVGGNSVQLLPVSPPQAEPSSNDDQYLSFLFSKLLM